jgi:LAO/AO transport system kinase
MSNREEPESALSVMGGVAPPPSINPRLAAARRRPLPTAAELLAQIRQGDRAALSRAITLIESALPAHRKLAGELLDLSLPLSGRSIRVGITGVPGVGKSTLIEALGRLLVEERGHRLAVLAVDPTSAATHGSILGDKSRMTFLSTHPRAFIRPSPTGGSLGGVAHQTRETIQLCEAAGFTVLFVETVGVGQSEVAVHGMVDCFVLLMLAGAGDELQGIKRGVMEMADVLAITKADGENRTRAKVARQQVINALNLLSPPAGGRRPQVRLCSALEGSGIEELWADVEAFIAHGRQTGEFARRRAEQAVAWMDDLVRRTLLERLLERPDVRERREDLQGWVRAGALTSRRAAEKLLETIEGSF